MTDPSTPDTICQLHSDLDTAARRAMARTGSLRWPGTPPQPTLPDLTGKTEAERAALLSAYNAALSEQDRHQEYRRTYRAMTAAIDAQFAAELAREYLDGVRAEACQATFEYAWSEGHSDGYERVEEIYRDVAQVVVTALSA